jgi:hypothetical protein
MDKRGIEEEDRKGLRGQRLDDSRSRSFRECRKDQKRRRKMQNKKGKKVRKKNFGPILETRMYVWRDEGHF